MTYWWFKLVRHNGPNHPAKSGGPCVRSNKVGFSLVNRVSLIFKGLTQTAAESSGGPIQIWGNYRWVCCYTRARTLPSTCIRLERLTTRIACLSTRFPVPKPRKSHYETVFCYFCKFLDHLGSKNDPRGYQKSPNHKNTPGIDWNATDLYTAQFLAQSDQNSWN